MLADVNKHSKVGTFLKQKTSIYSACYYILFLSINMFILIDIID
ncbi:hypothetical protein CIT292_06923 [Citrobacter youngae ATCC 29220]|uniref:Uncharacterized protein n=1 Tax=Citrobacter youngae ATCC 29220 TaxID=500640 RepID=D4B8Y5_9ENTR|nr:hypothetical protein CIT292_06923 [Citrobacter youngae ATCC 29220]